MAEVLQLELQYFLDLQIVSRTAIASLALYVWDYFLTFGMEVDLVWDSKWNAMKCLFLVQRYLPLADLAFLSPYQILGENMSIDLCRRVLSGLGVMSLTGTILSELLLALRVWAIWGRGKWPTIVLAVSLFVFWAPSYGYLAIFLKSMEFVHAPYPGLQGCVIISANKIETICYATSMTWNIGTLICTLIPGIRAYQAGGNSALFHVVYRDGVTYYFYLVVLTIVNVTAITAFPPGTQYLLLPMQRCLHTVLASRVLLHIRRQVRNDTEIPFTDSDIDLQHIGADMSMNSQLSSMKFTMS